ncbi:MAG: helix-turn-helix domain-containing protein [Phycisphaerales bacterium]|nr:helix-turn-helix domain-containing protein [Phycisphaerales bacterium]
MGKTIIRQTKDDYFELVKKKPLKRIGDEQQLDEAVWMLCCLDGRVEPPLSQGESDYADTLAALIKDYEHRNPVPQHPVLTGIELVRGLLEDFQLSQKQFGEILGLSESAASLILAGKRELTKTHISKLSKRFEIPTSAFF